jgi:hypothetical protein
MIKIFVIILATLFFDLLPFFVTPSMAIPIAEYLSLLVLIMAAFFLFYAFKRDALKYRLIGYSLICASIWLSSLSWFGMPFIDFVFMITALLAFIVNIFFVAILFRSNTQTSN